MGKSVKVKRRRQCGRHRLIPVIEIRRTLIELKIKRCKDTSFSEFFMKYLESSSKFGVLRVDYIHGENIVETPNEKY